ncbi:MAG: ABC transporter permease subunit, partial [Victivallaceae bacterium]
MSKKFVRYLIAAAVAVFMAVFIILPVYVVVANGLDWNLFAEVFRNPVYREGLFNSALIAVITTLMVFAIALPLALLYDRFDFPLKKYCAFMMMIPMILPPFVGALGFQQIFGYYGVLNSILAKFNLPPVDFLGGEFGLFAVCLIEALHLYPILYLNLIAVLGNVDPVLDEAAQNLGAGRWRRFCRVTFPLMRPGILAGGSIVMIWSFTELGTPLMFSFNRVTPVQVFNG